MKKVFIKFKTVDNENVLINDRHIISIVIGEGESTIKLSDGSAVNLSTGRYFTPEGVNLMETGGIAPDVEVVVDEDTFNAIYYGSLLPEEDPQIQQAVAVLLETAG